MEFRDINDIQKFVLNIRNSCNKNSNLYNDLDWFSTNKYTTPSEYFGELMLFVENLIKNNHIEKYKDDLIKLNEILQSYFN